MSGFASRVYTDSDDEEIDGEEDEPSESKDSDSSAESTSDEEETEGISSNSGDFDRYKTIADDWQADPNKDLLRNLVRQGASSCLTGLRFAFTGSPYPLDQINAEAVVRHFGGAVGRIDQHTEIDYLILGKDPDRRILQRAQDFEITNIRQTGLFSFIRSEPANGRRRKQDASEQAHETPHAKKRRIDGPQQADVNTRKPTPPPPEMDHWVRSSLQKLRKSYPADKFDCIMVRSNQDPWDLMLRARKYGMDPTPIDRTIPEMCYDERGVL